MRSFWWECKAARSQVGLQGMRIPEDGDVATQSPDEMLEVKDVLELAVERDKTHREEHEELLPTTCRDEMRSSTKKRDLGIRCGEPVSHWLRAAGTTGDSHPDQ